MIQYALKNSASALLYLNDSSVANPAKGSLTFDTDKLEIEDNVVERSGLPGAVQLGRKRLKSREVSLSFSRALGTTYATYASAENTLAAFLLDSVYLVDVTNNRQVPISISDYNVSYMKGGHKLNSDNELTIKFLEPFFTSLTEQTHNEQLYTGINDIEIINDGTFEVPPEITLTASNAVTSFQLYVEEKSEGIQIDDSLFGTPGYTVIVINCLTGTVMLGSYDRLSMVLPGTGFFTFPIGTSTLKINLSADAEIDLSWYKRYFI